jgi:hypothetical protein
MPKAKLVLADWRGTKRIQASATGGIDETCMSLPFGDSLTCTGQDVNARRYPTVGQVRVRAHGSGWGNGHPW